MGKNKPKKKELFGWVEVAEIAVNPTPNVVSVAATDNALSLAAALGTLTPTEGAAWSLRNELLARPDADLAIATLREIVRGARAVRADISAAAKKQTENANHAAVDRGEKTKRLVRDMLLIVKAELSANGRTTNKTEIQATIKARLETDGYEIGERTIRKYTDGLL